MSDPEDRVITIDDFCKLWRAEEMFIGKPASSGPQLAASPKGPGQSEVGRCLEVVKVSDTEAICKIDRIPRQMTMSKHWHGVTLTLASAAGIPVLRGQITNEDGKVYDVELMLFQFGPSQLILQCRYHEREHDRDDHWHDGMWHAPD
ncbi:MAG: hypothetical protein KDI71_22360 [Xanthomonadales bacterium]|nr:hypothetical protein [Xanthomonadales bacterium]